MLASVAGVGRKTAERIVVELKDKIEQGVVVGEGWVPAKGGKAAGVMEEAMAALMALGYSRAEAQDAVSIALKQARETPSSTEEAVRAALTVAVT